MEDVNLTGTTPAEEQTNTQADTDAAEAAAAAEETAQAASAAPEARTDTAGKETAAEPGDADAPFLRVKFRHENRDMSKEETVAFAQKGLLYDKIQPIYHQLDYLAAQHGVTVKAFVENLVQSAENRYREELVERLGDDETVIEDMMQLFRDRQKEKYEKIVADRERAEEEEWSAARQQRENMLAEQFVALQKEFPEIAGIADLPKEAVRLAAEGKMDLTAAYLLHKHREAKKIAAAEEQAAEQSKASTGAAGSEEAPENAVMNALLKGIRG